jgi:hypothetical protein
LRNGRPGGGTPDSFDIHPLPVGHPPQGFDDAVLTPPSAASSPRLAERPFRAFFANLERHERGEPLTNAIDPLAGSRLRRSSRSADSIVGWEGRAMKATLRKLWAGEIPLAVAFWEYTVVYGFVANLVATLGFFAAVAAEAPDALAILIFLLPVPYNLLVLVAVWRSADRHPGSRMWAELARAAAVLWFVAASVS